MVLKILSVVFPAVAALAAIDSRDPAIHLNEKEYFETPGFAFLVFHNNYQVGYQGGLQMILHGERILDSGDLYIVPQSGREARGFTVRRRVVDRKEGTATVYAEAGTIPYRLITTTDGKTISIRLRLDKPIDWTTAREAGLRIFIYPAAYYSRAFQAGTTGGVFMRQYSGSTVLAGPATTVQIAPGDPRRAVRFVSPSAGVVLRDERAGGSGGWFSVRVPIKTGSDQIEARLDITPSIDPEWRAPAVIGVSQTGYHPAQVKRAVLELDPRDPVKSPVKLYRDSDRGRQLVMSAAPKVWGRFLSMNYAHFDFTSVRDPGTYYAEYGGVSAGPFRIDASVYRTPWMPTLQYFFPVQMCHVKVREGGRTWHGACHLDDAQQAPENTPHLDGYRQGKRETRFADNEHIAGLDWGGWHDAGDHDLPAGSIAGATLTLSLAQEEFRPAVDVTSVNRVSREVILGRPDNRSDLLQQIEYGVEGLLASFRVAGRIFPGIIERNSGYGHIGDPVNITDNIVNSPGGAHDDRWVFTNRNTGLQYQVAQALAAASRVLGAHDSKLAAECRMAARKLWDYEQANEPQYAPNAYVPRDSGKRVQEIAAAAELLLTDPSGPYKTRLIELLPQIRSLTPEQFGRGPGSALVRVLPAVGDPQFESAVRELADRWSHSAAELESLSPYGVRYSKEVSQPEWKLEERSGIHSGFVWGHGWNLQQDAVAQYFFHKHLPERFGIEPLLTVVNFVHGVHPANNRSYVTGVGTNSALVAYGINRADWTGIPGGVISGVSLIKPDFMELKDFPYLWYQTEYVLGGAATYIFDVLAADRLLNP